MKPIHKIISLLALLILPMTSIAKEEPVVVTPASSFDWNVLLAGISAALAIIMWVFTEKLTQGIRRELKQKSNKIIQASAWLLIGLCSTSSLMAQAGTTNPIPDYSLYTGMLRWVLILVIVIQVIVIAVLISKVNTFPKAVAGEKEEGSWWARMNNFRPIDQEAGLDTGHDYDGIRELDNVTPTWFSTAFLLSIVFAAGYLYRYHIAKSAPLQEQEYAMEMKEADAKLEAYLKTQANKIDENSVQMLGKADIEAGAAVFATNCFACHGAKGEGGVGPNLTDAYWIHGGSLHDVFKSIKYGWIDNGMKAWKDDLSAQQIAQLTSYIKSLAGTNPPNAKAPQGAEYKEEAK